MPIDPGGLESVGVRLSDLVAGFGGGVVNALFFQRTSPGGALASVIGGAITANFLTGLAVDIVGQHLQPGVAGFIVGMTAMAICQGLFVVVNNWIKRLTGKVDA